MQGLKISGRAAEEWSVHGQAAGSRWAIYMHAPILIRTCLCF